MSNFASNPPPPYPRNIPLLKGALIAIDDSGGSRTTVPFQYNPETLRRSLRPNEVGTAEGDRSTAVRFTGAAVEMVSLEAHLEAVDQRTVSSLAAGYGIHPQLAALELFLYPSTAEVKRYESTLSSGSIDVVPPLAPRVLFVWGPHRVVPVRLSSMAVTEEFFDTNLNPVAATVALEMRVLTYSDVFSDNPDYSLFLSHQKNLETMASWVRPSNPKKSIGIDPTSPQETAPVR